MNTIKTTGRSIAQFTRTTVKNTRKLLTGPMESGGNPEEGSTTVEYAIGVVAAAGFAGLLIVILKSGAVRSALEGIIESALSL